MAIFFLIRHGVTDHVGNTITGRMPGVGINMEGRRQVERLAAHLPRAGPFHHLFSSPLERTRQTAEPLAKALGLPVQISEALNEINFGDWTGRTFAELEPDSEWKQWNQMRSTRRAPNGEMMIEVQSRMVRELERLRRLFPDDRLVLVSHGDPIKSVIAHCLGAPLDLLHRIVINPASISVVELTPWTSQVHCTNREDT